MHNHRMTASNRGTPVVVGIGPVSFDDVVGVARDGAAVAISEDALGAIAASRSRIEALANDPTPVYGVRPVSARSPPGTSPSISEPSCSAA